MNVLNLSVQIEIIDKELIIFKVPSYMSEFVMVTAWVQDNGMHLYPNTDIGGKYNVLSNGELYINNASPTDGLKSYTCRTINRLTGKSDPNGMF